MPGRSVTHLLTYTANRAITVAYNYNANDLPSYEIARLCTIRNQKGRENDRRSTNMVRSLYVWALWITVAAAVAEDGPHNLTLRPEPADQAALFLLPEGFDISLVASDKSIMPEGLEKRISRDELYDLVAYLRSH